jgi:hypothetical protein
MWSTSEAFIGVSGEWQQGYAIRFGGLDAEEMGGRTTSEMGWVGRHMGLGHPAQTSSIFLHVTPLGL